MKRSLTSSIRSGAAVGGLMLLAPLAHGAGFAIIEQSVAGLGNAFAGGAAVAEDASTIYFNPAGMSRLEGSQAMAGFHIINTSSQFTDDGGTGVYNPFTGTMQSMGGGDGGDAGGTGLIPNLYLTVPMTDRVRFGLGINAPFGLKTEYDSDWVGRYFAVESDVKTININPAFSYQVTDALSVGIGYNLQYIEGTLSNAVDFATICGGFASFGFPTSTCAGAPGSADGFAEITGSDWSGGINMGLLYAFSEGTRVGIHYRSHITHNLAGDADFSDVPAELLAIGAFVDSDATLSIALPETVSASIYHEVSDDLALMADLTWTDWTRFDELVITYDNGTQGSTVQPEEWNSNVRYSIGATWAMDKHWKLRGGLAYDETPIPSPEKRTPRIPGNDRTWISAGASYQYSADMRFDVGYAHLFVSDTEINHSNELGAVISGTYDSSVDIFSAQIQWAF